MKKAITILIIVVGIIGVFALNKTLGADESENLLNDTLYETTIQYNDDMSLYMGVYVTEDNKLEGFRDAYFTSGKGRNKDKHNVHGTWTNEDQELQSVVGYILDQPSDMSIVEFPKEEDLNLEYLNYDKLKEAWDSLELPKDLKNFSYEDKITPLNQSINEDK